MANEVSVDIDLEIRKAQQALNKLSKSIDNFGEKSAKSVGKMDVAIGSFAGNLAAQAASAIGGALIDLGKTAVEQAKKFEVLNTQFTVLTGSTKAAKSVLDDLTAFAASTPFQIEGISEAAKQLLSIKVPASELTSVLTKLGDIAAVTGTDIQELTIPYARLRSANRLTLEEIQKFQDRGVNVLGEFARKTKLSISDVRKEISAGRLPFKLLEETLSELTGTGGQFAGGMIKQSQTLAGVSSTLQDNFNFLAADIGKQLTPTIKELATATTEAIINFRDLLKIVSPDTSTQSGQIQKLANELEAAQTKYNALKRTNENAIGSIFLSDADVKAAKDNLDKIQKEFDAALLKKIETQKKASAAGTTDAPVSPSGLNPQGERDIEAEKERLKQLNKLREEQAIMEAELKVLRDEEKMASDELSLVNLETKLTKEQELKFKQLEAVAKLEKDSQIKKEKLDKVAQQKEKAILEQRFKDRESYLSQKDKLERQSAERSASIAVAGANFLATVSKNSSKEIFLIQKAAAIAQSLVSTNVAYARTMASIPYPANIAAAEQVRVLGLINTATIAATALQGFRDGGIVGGNSTAGDQIVGRLNSGEMILNKSQQRNLFAMANGGGGGDIVVEIDGREVARAVRTQKDEGFIL